MTGVCVCVYLLDFTEIAITQQDVIIGNVYVIIYLIVIHQYR